MASSISVSRIHHIEFIVGNALQAAYFYRKALGFSLTAYLGPETGHPDRASYVLEQGRVRFVFTSPLEFKDFRNPLLMLHGDGVRDVCFEAGNVDTAFKVLCERGAVPVTAPHTLEDDHGTLRKAAVKAYGDVIHSLVSTKDYNGPFMPGFQARNLTEPGVGFTRVDHVVANTQDRQMDRWCDFYRDIFDFEKFVSYDDKDISTEYTALRSTVMANETRKIKFPINEPAKGKRKSQIQEYIDFNYSAGVQHIALYTADIVSTVGRLRDRGLVFLTIPDAYYDSVWDRVGEIEEDRDLIREYGILADRDDKGYLLQIFTRPLQDRPTFFLEVIQRAGCESFGKGNFKALFESIELEQGKRGNL